MIGAMSLKECVGAARTGSTKATKSQSTLCSLQRERIKGIAGGDDQVLPITQHIGNGCVAEGRCKPAMPKNFAGGRIVPNDMTRRSSGEHHISCGIENAALRFRPRT